MATWYGAWWGSREVKMITNDEIKTKITEIIELLPRFRRSKMLSSSPISRRRYGKIKRELENLLNAINTNTDDEFARRIRSEMLKKSDLEER